MKTRLGNMAEVLAHFGDIPLGAEFDQAEKGKIPGTFESWKQWLNDPHTRHWFEEIKEFMVDAQREFHMDGRQGDLAVGRFQALQLTREQIVAIMSVKQKESESDERK